VSVDGIIIGTDYTFVVTAENDIGTSPPSDPSPPIKAATYADPPSGVSAIDGQDGQTTVSWTASAYDGESPVISYTVFSYSQDDPTVYVDVAYPPSSSIVLSGLINGFQYVFYVSVTNGFGENPTAGGPSAEITPLGPPTQPLNVVTYAGDGNANVTWDAPLSDGGASIDAYIVTSSPSVFSDILVPPFPQFLSLIANGLTNGIPYTFTVIASNSKGNSSASAPSAAVTPLGAPDPPTNVTAVPGNAFASVSWDAPVNTGGSPIESYTVVSTPDGISITVSGLSTTVPGLANGFPYTFTVYATNEINASSVESIPSSPVIPRTVPSSPRLPIGLSGNTQIDLAWLVPLSDGGSPIINYTVTSFPAASGPQSTVDDSTTLLITNLTNGVAYTFTVYATNLAGNSIESVLSDPITPTGANVPDPPGGVSAILDAPGKITVGWATPVSDGGSAITSYTVTPDPADVPPESVPPSNSFVFDNLLTNGTSYTFTVIATNGVGSSLASVPSPSVIPIARPSVVQSVLATPRNQGAIVTWAQPLSDGGSPLINYTVNYKVSTDSVYTTINVGPSNFSHDLAGLLTNSTLYDFYVGADNALYTGDVGSPVQTTPGPTVADPPNIISVTPGTGEVTIEFAPNIYDGGGLVSYYLVEDPANIYSATPSSSPAVLSALAPGTTYTFTVKTVTSEGTSLASAPSSSVTVL
jgi:titin